MVPHLMIGVLIRWRNLDTEGDTTERQWRRERLEQSIYKTRISALPEARRSKEGVSPGATRESAALPTLCFWTSDLRQ